MKIILKYKDYFWFICLQNVELVVDKVKQTNMVSEYRDFLIRIDYRVSKYFIILLLKVIKWWVTFG